LATLCVVFTILILPKTYTIVLATAKYINNLVAQLLIASCDEVDLDQLKILVADDNEDAADGLSLILKMKECHHTSLFYGTF
jgi:hypothetical protein